MADAVPIRSAKEIAGMRVACRLAREILDKAHATVKPGVTTDEIDRVVSQLIDSAPAMWQSTNIIIIHLLHHQCQSNSTASASRQQYQLSVAHGLETFI